MHHTAPAYKNRIFSVFLGEYRIQTVENEFSSRQNLRVDPENVSRSRKGRRETALSAIAVYSYRRHLAELQQENRSKTGLNLLPAQAKRGKTVVGVYIQ